MLLLKYADITEQIAEEETLLSPEEYLQASANQGLDKALWQLGEMYRGRGDLVGAFRQYKKSADKHKNALSQHRVALCYLNGEGVLQNRQLAMTYAKAAASLFKIIRDQRILCFIDPVVCS